MKILVAGDTHGKEYALLPKIRKARELGIQKVLQVGDFGLWDHTFAGVQFLDAVQAAAEEAQLTVHAIGGNHENWDHWEWYVKNLPTSHGWAMVRSRIALAPKVHTWKWNSKRFVGAGGGVSIDKDFYRLPKEAGTYRDEYGRIHPATGPRTMYWPNEQLTDGDVLTIKGFHQSPDYLVTHDCSNRTPWKDRLKPDMDSQMHRQRIDEVLRVTQPKLHFHGHMHTKYDWENLVGARDGEAVYTQTYGLECDDDFWSYGILDTADDSFVWRDGKLFDF